MRIFNVNYLKQKLLITTFIVMGTSCSYALAPLSPPAAQQQLQTKVTQLEKTLTQTQTALTQEKTARAKDVQTLTQTQTALTQEKTARAKDVQISAECQIDRTKIQGQVTTLQSEKVAAATALTQAKATYDQQLKAAIDKANAAHALALQNAQNASAAEFEQLLSTHEAALRNIHADHQVALERIRLNHDFEISQHQQQLQASVIEAGRLQNALLVAQQNGGGGGDPQVLLALQTEINNLRTQLALHNPVAVAAAINLPVYSNPAGFIYGAQAMNADPQLAQDVNAARLLAIRHIDDLYTKVTGIPSIIVGRGAMLIKRQVKQSLENLKSAIDLPMPIDIHAIDWDAFDREQQKIEGNLDNFDKIPPNDVDLVGLKQQLIIINTNKPRVIAENKVNVFNNEQQQLARLTPLTVPLDVLADQLLAVQLPALKALLNLHPPMSPPAQTAANEIIEQLQKGEFNLLSRKLDTSVPKTGQKVFDYLQRQIGANATMTAYKNAVSHYVGQVTALTAGSAAARDIHLLRHGVTRFNNALGALHGAVIVHNHNNAILQRILTTPTPLDLTGEPRKNFAADIGKLASEKEADLAPHADAIRNLTGSYGQVSKATVSLYTESNKPFTP